MWVVGKNIFIHIFFDPPKFIYLIHPLEKKIDPAYFPDPPPYFGSEAFWIQIKHNKFTMTPDDLGGSLSLIINVHLTQNYYINDIT